MTKNISTDPKHYENMVVSGPFETWPVLPPTVKRDSSDFPTWVSAAAIDYIQATGKNPYRDEWFNFALWTAKRAADFVFLNGRGEGEPEGILSIK